MHPSLPLLEREALARFGIPFLRPAQRELLDAVLSGRDVLGILPTGGGKSLAYQLPALLSERVTVVVSPLLALTRDQRAHLARAGIDAVELDSTVGEREARAIAGELAAGRHRILFVTPERLRTGACLDVLCRRGVALVAVDEAHCVSQWGHDFRPAYLSLAGDLARLGRPPVLALTATATAEVQADIAEQLALRDPCVVRAPLARPNLALAVERTVNEAAKRSRLVALLAARTGSTIVYAATVKTVESLHAWLCALRVPAARYHGQLGAAERERAEAAFLDGSAPVLVATKAFGLGIDKPDVRHVIHAEVPDSIESYWQEAGRAGRDGAPARATLLYRLEDRRIQAWFLAGKYPRPADVAAVHAAIAAGLGRVAAIAAATMLPDKRVEGVVGHLAQLGVLAVRGDVVEPATRAGAGDGALVALYDARRAKDRARLAAMCAYAQSTACREQTVLRYFGEAPAGPCGRCDNCVASSVSSGDGRRGGGSDRRDRRAADGG